VKNRPVGNSVSNGKSTNISRPCLRETAHLASTLHVLLSPSKNPPDHLHQHQMARYRTIPLTKQQPYQRHSDVTVCRQHALASGLMVECSIGFRLSVGRQLIIRDLCVPSMGENQKGFKSLVDRMKTETTIRSQLRKGDRPWEGRLGKSRRPMNKNHIRGRRDRLSWHNTAKACHSVPEVNVAVRWRRFSSLPGEWERSGHR